jgi:hypothetical protein
MYVFQASSNYLRPQRFKMFWFIHLHVKLNRSYNLENFYIFLRWAKSRALPNLLKAASRCRPKTRAPILWKTKKRKKKKRDQIFPKSSDRSIRHLHRKTTQKQEHFNFNEKAMCSYLHLHVPLIKCQIEKDYH